METNKEVEKREKEDEKRGEQVLKLNKDIKYNTHCLAGYRFHRYVLVRGESLLAYKSLTAKKILRAKERQSKHVAAVDALYAVNLYSLSV
jgi:hypothetical protein